MKQIAIGTMGAGGLAVVLASLGFLVILNLDYALARFPGSQPAGEMQVEMLHLWSGHVSQAASYQTGAPLTTVWGWYRDTLQAETPPEQPRSTVVPLAALRRSDG